MIVLAGRPVRSERGFESQYPRDYRGIATNVPRDVAEAFGEWCDRAEVTKRDVLASMVGWFLDHESEFAALLDGVHAAIAPGDS